jgi:2-haloalkanoic acid dehalogenase type II
VSSRATTKAVLIDLLMATMDSISAWVTAVGDHEAGLAWRDAVTDRMLAAGRYVPYEALVADAAAALQLDPNAVHRLREAWMRMEPWPDVGALDRLTVPYAFVTNCSAELAAAAVARSGRSPVFTLSAEEAGWYKPRAEVYRLACERAGVKPDEARFIAGAAYDAEGARAAGLGAILILRRPPPGSLSPAIRVAESLTQALVK